VSRSTSPRPALVPSFCAVALGIGSVLPVKFPVSAFLILCNF
jgi:hypothetical protein